MAFSDHAQISHFTRVEQWECDYNRHWNTRFYARSFGFAADCCFSQQIEAARPNLVERHIRFHREMMVGSAIAIYTAQLHEDAQVLVHYLYGNGTLSATAVERYAEPIPNLGLPLVPEADCTEARTRGLTPERRARAIDGWDGIEKVPLLTLRATDLEQTGALLPEVVMRLSATSSHRKLNAVGLTREFSERTGVNRMNAECCISLRGQALAGDIIFAQSRITAAEERNFVAAHRLLNHRCQEVALVELCLLAVDLNTRRVTDVPDFIRSAAE